MAGVRSPEFRERVAACLAGLGWPRVILQHDLLAIFCSGTWRDEGYALIAGTGTVAARVVGGRLDRVVGGRGWLLGDAGGGFWIGHRVARAVVADLDGQAEPTALTPLVLDAVGARDLADLVPLLYAQRPVQLAEFAPLPFAVSGDPTAQGILAAASAALADLVAAVRVPDLDGPVVGGGSVLVRGFLAASPELRAELVPLPADLVTVGDGVVGAGVLALRETGVVVGERLFQRLTSEIA
jgi:glucosamine kinase